MKKTRKQIVALLTLTFMTLLLIGCTSAFKTASGTSPTSIWGTTAPAIIESPNPPDTLAQATLDSSQSQLLDLSRQATEVSLNMSQAAKSAALSTQDYNQRKKIELEFESTVVSLNITQAAATQNFFAQQTKMANDATVVAQSAADAATQTAYLVNVTQTARAQAILDAQVLQTIQAAASLTAVPLTATYSAYQRNATEAARVQMILNAEATQTAQAVAALTAYPQTATPFAVTKAALLLQEYGREQQNFVSQVVDPLIPFLAALVFLLFILVIILAYRRLLSMPWPARLRIGRSYFNPNSLNMIDGVMMDRDAHFHQKIPSEPISADPTGLQSEPGLDVVIVDATEPSVAHWIAEVERQLTTKERL